MAFTLEWADEADIKFKNLEERAKRSLENRKKSKKTKSSKVEGLFKQVKWCIKFLKDNPKHPSLQTHKYESLTNPYDPNKKVFEAYAQQSTPAAYRVFWCYGPNRGQITIIDIDSHPED